MQKDKPARKRARVHFASLPGRTPPTAKTLQERFAATGGNTGNLIAGEALFRLLDVDLVSAGGIGDPEEFKDNVDLIVIPSLSLLSSSDEAEWLYRLVEQTNQPIVAASINARFPTKNVEAANPHPQTVKLLKAIAERSKSIGVAGQFTADILHKIGISNSRVIGCPSVFRTGKHLLNIKRSKNPTGSMFFHGSSSAAARSYSEIHAREVELKLLKTAVATQSPFIFQNEWGEIQAASGVSREQYSSDCMNTLLNLGGDIPLDAYCNYLATHAQVFFDAAQWASFAAEHDVAVGTRFRGNLLAIGQGIPAVIIASDSRAIEICETFKLPFVYLRHFLMTDLSHLIESLDFSAFESHYPKARDQFVEFLDENRLPHRM